MSYPAQEEWFRLRREHGEARVRKALAAKLRLAAQRVEDADVLGKGDVFGCQIENCEPELFKDSFIETISVTISLPWPG